jgi:hypothetical protein
VALQDDDEDGADLVTLSGWSAHPWGGSPRQQPPPLAEWL